MTREEMLAELTDRITDFMYEEANQAICCDCSLNHEEPDIDTTSCPCDFDLFTCEYVDDLSGAIERAVNEIRRAIEDAPCDEIDFFDYE